MQGMYGEVEKMKHNSCHNCKNRYGNYCTMMFDIKKAQYKKCSGWSVTLPPKKKILISHNSNRIKEIKRNINQISKKDMAPRFRRFLEKGGHYSFRTEEVIL